MKSTTKDSTKSETIKKANTKKAAMKNVGNTIAEFGVKNMEAGSKASRGSKKDAPAKPNLGAKEPARKGGPSKAGASAGSSRSTKKRAF